MLRSIAATAAKSLQWYLTVRSHRRQPTRLLHPWDSPGKNTGVGCHCLLPRKMQWWSTVKETQATNPSTLQYFYKIKIENMIDFSLFAHSLK